MERTFFISMFLDTRRPKANGKYPVKLRIFTPSPRKQMLYSTLFEFTKSEFKSIWETLKPREEYKMERNKLRAVEKLANDIADTLKPFSFTQFEKKYLRNKGDGNNVIYQYLQTISKLRATNSHSTASNYETSLKSFKDFIIYNKGKEPVVIPFFDITPDWLQNYENYMIKHLKRSQTTVSMYVRTLRTVFNSAITDKEIDAEIYPFGKGKYQPPAVRNVKKSLSKEDLKKLFKSEPSTNEQTKAKDFWFFSYACNGMNVKDIALLKYENIKADTIVFYRAKTLKTSKTDLRPVTVYLTDHSNKVIEKYGNKDKKPKNYIFPILSNEKTEFENHRAIKNFTIFINKNLKKLAQKNGIEDEISTYWARHSFATNSIREGATMAYVMEALSHSNMKTTMGYFAGFEDKDKKEFMKKLMDFE